VARAEVAIRDGLREITIEMPPGLPDREWASALCSLFSRGGNDESMRYLVVDGEPWSKSRPRFTKRGATYQPRDDSEAEQRLAWRMKASSAVAFPGNVMLACRFYRGNEQRIDADNLVKHVCDSANGVWWADDSQVTLVIGEVQYDPARPRTIIMAASHVSTMLRGDDRQEPCARCGKSFIPAYGRKGSQRFCSATCGCAARRVVLERRACPQCNESFEPKDRRQVYCSVACGAQARGTRQPGSNCTECGKELAHRRGGRCRDCWRANPGTSPRKNEQQP
jgi:Holliday junction resolvase RusA-like endonuclease